MNKDIRNYNEKGQQHGYQQWYYFNNNNKLLIRGYRKNDNCIGYEEWYGGETTNFYIR